MALHRGIQSAIFYYLSCAPCTGYTYRKKRRRQAHLDRADKEALEEEHPGLYRHPSPFATNPNWQTEIDLGPVHGPAGRKKKPDKKGSDNLWALRTSESKNGSKNGSKNSAEAGSNDASHSSLGAGRSGPGSDTRFDSKLNLKRHQRADEQLWGARGSDMPYSKQQNSNLDGSTVATSRPPTARTTRTDKTTRSYYSATNPPINDLHPAIVTRLETREDAAWMMQPPPPARVMAGKERVDRDRSDSGGSRLSNRQGAGQLSSQPSDSILHDKVRRGRALQAPAKSRDPLRRRSSDLTGRETRNSRVPANAVESSSEDEDEPLPNRRTRKSRAGISEDSVDSAMTTIIRRPKGYTIAGTTARVPERVSRQHLPPIKTDSSSQHTRPPIARGNGNDKPANQCKAPRPPLVVKSSNSSLTVLQSVVPSGTLLSVAGKQTPAKSPSFEARVSLPPMDSAEENELNGFPGFRSPNWQETDGEWELRFPHWASKRVHRDVRHRWSMDF